MKKWIGLAIILVVVIGVVIAGYLYWKRSQLYPSTEDAYVHGDVYPVAPRVPGKILTYLVSDNQVIDEGQVVATLDPSTFQQVVDQDRAALEKARSVVAQTEAELARVRAQVAAAASRLDLAQIDRRRFSELYDRTSVPKQRYDQAVSAEQVARADHQAAQKAVDAVAGSLKVARDEVKVRETHLANAELMLSYTTVAAPVGGMVSKSSGQPGQVVSAGQPLCAIVPLQGRHVWIDANFKETQLKRIRVGQPVTFRTDVNPDRTYHGHVASLSAGTGAAFALLPPENATGNWVKIVQRLPVRITIDPGEDPGNDLRLGLSIHVEVDTLAPVSAPAATPAPAAAPSPAGSR